jgi:hypothetical protein
VSEKGDPGRHEGDERPEPAPDEPPKSPRDFIRRRMAELDEAGDGDEKAPDEE